MKSNSIGRKIISLDEVSSSNEYAVQLTKESTIDDGTIVWAQYQSAGKGYAGNSWFSSKGKNLTFSIILKPDFLKPVDQFYISKIVALSVKEFLELYLQNVSIKWPNDIYSNSAKIAGILIENTFIGQKFHYSIAGIGINVNQISFPNNIPNPSSIGKITGQSFELNDCLKLFCEIMDKNYITLKEGNLTLIDYNYINNLFQLGEIKEYLTPSGAIMAKITEVKKTGEIVLKNLEGNENLYGFKEIQYL